MHCLEIKIILLSRVIVTINKYKTTIILKNILKSTCKFQFSVNVNLLNLS
jgi:hypothetical protein